MAAARLVPYIPLMDRLPKGLRVRPVRTPGRRSAQDEGDSRMTSLLRRPLDWLRQWFTTAEKRPNLGRNDPCWCGSGKKYKACHLTADEKKRLARRK